MASFDYDAVVSGPNGTTARFNCFRNPELQAQVMTESGYPSSTVAGEWDSFWSGITPESEIQMWDFYGGRPWVLKYTPRCGRILEAGCGLGRYVFYFSMLGMNVAGLDFHAPTLVALERWSKGYRFDCTFSVGNVAQLPYPDNSLAGYLSFGVIEHFQEGPAAALSEAYRVLRPGGIAIISTPSISFSQTYFRVRRRAKDFVKRLVRRPRVVAPFFQYWYTPRQLHDLVQASGLNVVEWGGCDLKYAILELAGQSTEWFRIADWLEQTSLRHWGAQSFTVSIKTDALMHCFLCNERQVPVSQLDKFSVPICHECGNLALSKYYVRGQIPKFDHSWQYDPPKVLGPSPDLRCHFCQTSVSYHGIFEDYGFSVPVCPECLRLPEKNIVLANDFLQPRWRPRMRTKNADVNNV